MSERSKEPISTLAVATITTGVVLVHGFSGVSEAFEQILGHPVWTHEIPSFSCKARDLVLAQYPDFPVAVPDRSQWEQFAAGLIERYGETIDIVEGDCHRDTDPLTSAVRIVRKPL